MELENMKSKFWIPYFRSGVKQCHILPGAGGDTTLPLSSLQVYQSQGSLADSVLHWPQVCLFCRVQNPSLLTSMSVNSVFSALPGFCYWFLLLFTVFCLSLFYEEIHFQEQCLLIPCGVSFLYYFKNFSVWTD